MKITMVNNRIGVEKASKVKKQGSGLAFSIPEDTNCNGVVRYSYVGSMFPVGAKILFGGQREQIVVEGKEIQVMSDSNVIAIIDEDTINEEVKP